MKHSILRKTYLRVESEKLFKIQKGHNKEYLGKANAEHLEYINKKLASSNFANYIEEKDCRYLVLQEQGM